MKYKFIKEFDIMFKFLHKIAAVTYNFLDLFSLYTAVLIFISAGVANFINGGIQDD
jgi:hypothetical protein